MGYLSESVQASLEARGWEFVPTGPDEWEWVKFSNGKVIARQGSQEWKTDLTAAQL